jgi:hypothetical protein
MEKVIAKFTDGSTYTWKNVYVDCGVDWSAEETKLWKVGEDIEESSESIKHLDDLLCIMQKTKGTCFIWTNPKFNNVHICVETGKKRGSYDKVNKTSINYRSLYYDRAKFIDTKLTQLEDDINNFSLWKRISKFWR